MAILYSMYCCAARGDRPLARAAAMPSSTVFRTVKARSSEEKGRPPIKMMNFWEGADRLSSRAANAGIRGFPQIFEHHQMAKLLCE